MDRDTRSGNLFQKSSAGSRPIGAAPEGPLPSQASQPNETFRGLPGYGESSRATNEKDLSDTDDPVNAYRARFEKSRSSRPRHNLVPRRYQGIGNGETIKGNKKPTMNNDPWNPYGSQAHLPPRTTHRPPPLHNHFNFSQPSYHVPPGGVSGPSMPYQSHQPSVGMWSQPTAYQQSNYRAPRTADIQHGAFPPKMNPHPRPDMSRNSSTFPAGQAGSETVRNGTEPRTSTEQKQREMDRELQRILVEKVVRETWEMHIPQILEGTHSSYIPKIREATHDLERLLAEVENRKAEAELDELQRLETERRPEETLAKDDTDASTLESKDDSLDSEIDTAKDEGIDKSAFHSNNDRFTAYETTTPSQSSPRPKTEFESVLPSRASPNESERQNAETYRWAKKYETYAESIEDADLPSREPRESDQSSWRLNDLDQKVSKLQERFDLAEDRNRETEERMHHHYQSAMAYQKETARRPDIRMDRVWSPSTDSESGHLGNESASDADDSGEIPSVFRYLDPDSSTGSDHELGPERVPYEAPDPPSAGVRSVRAYSGERQLAPGLLVSPDRSLLLEENEPHMQLEMERFRLGLRIVRDELVDPIFRTLLSELKDSRLGGASGLSRQAGCVSEVSSPTAIPRDWSSTRREYMLDGQRDPLPLTEGPTEARSLYTPRTYLQALLSKQLENSKEIIIPEIREPNASVVYQGAQSGSSVHQQ